MTYDPSAGGGGGTPGGVDTEVQYNDGGSFGGASNWTYDDVTGRLRGTAEAHIDGPIFMSTTLAQDGDPITRMADDETLSDEDFYLGKGFQYVGGATNQYQLAVANRNPAGLFFDTNGSLGAVTLAAFDSDDVSNVAGANLGRPDGWNAAIEVDGRALATGPIIRVRLDGTNAATFSLSAAGDYLTAVRQKLEVTNGGEVESNSLQLQNLASPNFTSAGTDFGLWVDSNGGGGVPIFKIRDDAGVDILSLYDALFTVGNYTFDINQTVGASQDNFVLTYDDASGEIRLEAASAGAGARELISTTNITALTSIDIPWDETVYSKVELIIEDMQVGTDSVHLEARLGHTDGTTFISSANYSVVFNAGTSTWTSTTGQTEMRLTGGGAVGNAAAEYIQAEIVVNNFTSANNTASLDARLNYHNTLGNLIDNKVFGRLLASSNAFDTLRLFPSSGSFAAGGTIKLYGYRI